MYVRSEGIVCPVFLKIIGILAWLGKMMFDLVFEHVMMSIWRRNIHEKYLWRCLVLLQDLFSIIWLTRCKEMAKKRV